MTGDRLPDGGLIDRERPLRFRFNGRGYAGYEGDTLASALLANGVRVIGRSFKRHRPRGVMSAGVEEPNAIVQLGEGAFTEPNPPATVVELTDRLVAGSVNAWPSLGFDVLAINDALSRFMPAGFYYKTFLWPDWRMFEGAIRRAAGLGRAPTAPDPDVYDARWADCDLLVVGLGAAGLAAAAAAAKRGERVIAVEQDTRAGGALLWREATVEGCLALDWVEQQVRDLQALPMAHLLTRTTAIGSYDDNEFALVQRAPGDTGRRARRTLWRVRAARVVLATGAIERPTVFPGNDRPGVMLASAAQAYVKRYGVRPGRRAVVFTHDDSAYEAAKVLEAAGVEVLAVVDGREGSEAAPPGAGSPKAPVLRGRVVATQGRTSLRRVTVVTPDGRRHEFAADLLCMCGGWSPTVHLASQSGERPVWNARAGAFGPGASRAQVSIGGCAGDFDIASTLAEARLGAVVERPERGDDRAPKVDGAPSLPARGARNAFVDFQSDVTAADVALAARENFVSVEHLKRYTALGMGTDQGKTSNVNGLALLAGIVDRTPAKVGTTRFRPPFTPIPLAAFGGFERGSLFRPFRRLPAHDRHEAAGAVFEELGGWYRPVGYPRRGETAAEAERREALAVRTAAGLFDASPFGKIEVVGPDASEFLARIYATRIGGLKVGEIRYGLMLDERGALLDDGVLARLAEDRYWVGASSAHADVVADWLEEWLQCEWPDLQVLTAPVTDTFGVVTLAGPAARDVLAAAGVDFDISAMAFPHMSWREGRVAGIAARVFRVSFTGEVTFEINVAASQTAALWDALVAAGAPKGVAPVGVDAWMLLSVEKGYLHLGSDTDKTTLPGDVGWDRLLRRKGDFVGRGALSLPDAMRGDRLQLVGLEVLDDGAAPAPGTHLVRSGERSSEGYVTSSGESPTLGRPVALARVRAGRARLGEVLELAESHGARVRIAPRCAFDPEGHRIHG